MGGRMSKNKGAKAEREVAKLIEKMLAPVGEFDLHRNLDQTRDGGYDLKGLPGIALEVKRVERLNVSGWWRQTLEQATDKKLALLAYRQNRKPWTFVLKAEDAAAYFITSLENNGIERRTVSNHGLLAFLTEAQFMQWVRCYAEHELNK